MENKQFEILLERIRIRVYPEFIGYSMTVDQFFRLQDKCSELITHTSPKDSNALKLITTYLLYWKERVDDPVALDKRLAHSLKGKISLLEAIEKVIDAYQTDDSKDSVLLVHGDKANQKAHFKIYGDPQSAAMAFAALLDKNPEDLKMFMRGIEEVKKHAPGIN